MNAAPATLIHGPHAVGALLRERPHTIATIFLARHDRRGLQLQALAATAKVPCQQVDSHWLDRHTGAHHQGVAAQLKDTAPAPTLEQLLAQLPSESATPPLILALDGVQDPHNLGACLRVADGVGALALLAPQDRSAPLSAAALKSASGSQVPLIRVTNLRQALEKCKSQGLWIAGASEHGTAMVMAQDLVRPLVWVFGSEGSGLRRLTAESCDFLLRVPMAGSVGSFNVSVAAGICCYETRRQQYTQSQHKPAR